MYQHVPHYRAAIFAELQESTQFDFTVAADLQSRDQTILLVDPLPWPTLRLRNLWIGPFLWQRGILGPALRREFDILIMLGDVKYISTWVVAAVSRLRRVPVYLWTHGWKPDARGVQEPVRTAFYRLACGLLLYGDIAKQVGGAKGFDPQRLHVIYNSLDVDAQRAAQKAIGRERVEEVRRQLFTDPAPIVLCSSRLTLSRRLDLLLQAGHLLGQHGHRVNILLVGDGPEGDALRAMAQGLQVAVRFEGACYDERRLAELTMAATVTVSPGRVGLTAMQSLVYGVPVITHGDPTRQTPEHEAVIPGRTGEFFEYGNASALASAIRRWTAQIDVPDAIRADCMAIIERRYSPARQRFRIEQALRGEPAER